MALTCSLYYFKYWFVIENFGILLFRFAKMEKFVKKKRFRGAFEKYDRQPFIKIREILICYSKIYSPKKLIVNIPIFSIGQRLQLQFCSWKVSAKMENFSTLGKKNVLKIFLKILSSIFYQKRRKFWFFFTKFSLQIVCIDFHKKCIMKILIFWLGQSFQHSFVLEKLEILLICFSKVENSNIFSEKSF